MSGPSRSYGPARARTHAFGPTAVGRILASARLISLVPLAVSIAACSSGTEPSGPTIAAELVGSWTAVEMLVTSQENANVDIELIGEANATFELTIQASGAYQAILTFADEPGVESGQASSTGSSITLDPEPGPPATGTWSLTGGVLIIDTETTFDFNMDGTPDDADLHLEMVRD